MSFTGLHQSLANGFVEMASPGFLGQDGTDRRASELVRSLALKIGGMVDDSERRVVEARMKLRERWRAKTLATRALSDPAPRGTGPKNRHGMPQLPPGQKKTEKWPVLDLGRQPKVALEEWVLTLDGACEAPLQVNWHRFQALPQVEDCSDFHCVTGWSKLDMKWLGCVFPIWPSWPR